MSINRHNYETFFLLYVDNELSAADRKAVDVFVSENADLKIELDSLMQSTLTADTIMFDNKAALLREEDITALQQTLLLYVDNELGAAETAATEKLILNDSSAKKELGLLQQTKLQADTAVIFADKKSLYRKESGKLVFLNWKRIAAAAVLLGFGIWIAATFIKTGKSVNSTETIAKGNEENLPGIKKADKTTPVPPNLTINTTDEINTAAAKENNGTQSSTQKNILPGNKEPMQNVILPENQNNTVVKKETTNDPKPSNNLPKPLQNFNNNGSNQNDVTIVKPENNNSGNKTIVDPLNQIENPAKTNLTEPAINAYAINAAYTNNNAGEQSEDGVFMVSNEKVKKTKLGGFLRKVKRLVERTTNIKTGNGIKVAGFDIAIK